MQKSTRKPSRRRGSPWWTSVLFCAGPEGTCWEWTAGTGSKGYGQLKVFGKFRQVHRIVYEEMRGPIAEGLQLDHLCRNRLCCNPSHVEPVTPAVNTARGLASGAYTLTMGFCKRGHAYEGDNVYVKPNSSRQCRACRSLAAKRYEVKKKAQTLR